MNNELLEKCKLLLASKRNYSQTKDIWDAFEAAVDRASVDSQPSPVAPKDVLSDVSQKVEVGTGAIITGRLTLDASQLATIEDHHSLMTHFKHELLTKWDIESDEFFDMLAEYLSARDTGCQYDLDKHCPVCGGVRADCEDPQPRPNRKIEPTSESKSPQATDIVEDAGDSQMTEVPAVSLTAPDWLESVNKELGTAANEPHGTCEDALIDAVSDLHSAVKLIESRLSKLEAPAVQAEVWEGEVWYCDHEPHVKVKGVVVGFPPGGTRVSITALTEEEK